MGRSKEKTDLLGVEKTSALVPWLLTMEKIQQLVCNKLSLV